MTNDAYLAAEARSRVEIDHQLVACGWVVQSRPEMNLYAARGIAVRGPAAEPTFVATAAAAGASRSFIEGVTKTTADQAGISGSDLRLVPIPLAPVEEQRRIVSEVERRFSLLDACERAVDTGLARAGATRRSVLKAAFEGKLVPQDPSDEPASVLLERIRAERAAAPNAARRSRRTA